MRISRSSSVKYHQANYAAHSAWIERLNFGHQLDLSLSTLLQVLPNILAAIAAIASAIAAWQSSVTSNRQLAFQKNLAKDQDSLFQIRLTLTSLRKLKRLTGNPLAANDTDFMSIERMYLDIKKDLEELSQRGFLPPERSFFDAPSLAVAMSNAMDTVPKAFEAEIARIEIRISCLFS